MVGRSTLVGQILSKSLKLWPKWYTIEYDSTCLLIFIKQVYE